jgi:hypothetical protein
MTALDNAYAYLELGSLLMLLYLLIGFAVGGCTQ